MGCGTSSISRDELKQQNAMQQHTKEYPDSYFWFDLFTNDQHNVRHKSFEWFSSTFRNMIHNIGATLLILSPWNDPVLLRRVWCLFEVYNALETSAKLHIQVPRSEREILADAVVHDSDCLIQKLSNIRIEKAEATMETDKDRILKVIQNSEGGYHGVSKQVKDRLRAWYMEQLDDLVRESPDNHHLQVITAEICFSFGSFGQALEHASRSLASDDALIKFKSYCIAGRVYAAQYKFEHALVNYDEALKLAEEKEEIHDFGLKKEMSILYINKFEALMQNLEFKASLKSLQQATEFITDELAGNDYTAQEWTLLIQWFKIFVSVCRNLKLVIGNFGSDIKDEEDEDMNLFGEIMDSDMIDMMLEATENMEQEGIHHQLPDLYQFIAVVYSAEHKFNDTLMYYHKSLESKRELLGEIHLDIADIHGDMGVTYYQLDDVQEAFSHMRQSLEIRQIVTGKNSLGVASSYYDLASVHNNRGEYEQAFQLTREASDIILNIFGEDSPHALAVHRNLYGANKRLGNTEAAEQCEEKFDTILELVSHKFGDLEDDSSWDGEV